MINIYKRIIINYINTTLSPSIIKEYAASNRFNISNSESIIIYNFIKENYQSVLNGDESKLLELQKLVRKDLYLEIMRLYNEYKNKFF